MSVPASLVFQEIAQEPDISRPVSLRDKLPVEDKVPFLAPAFYHTIMVNLSLSVYRILRRRYNRNIDFTSRKYVSGHKKFLINICVMKGVNRFDRQSLFTAKKYAQIIGLFSKKEHLLLDDALR